MKRSRGEPDGDKLPSMERIGSAHALRRLLADCADLLKQPTVGHELARAGVNTSIALLAVDGVSAYLNGDERRASDDLRTAADEIQARRERR